MLLPPVGATQLQQQQQQQAAKLCPGDPALQQQQQQFLVHVGLASIVGSTSSASSVSFPRFHPLYPHQQQQQEGGPGGLMQLSQSLPSSLHQQPPWHKGPQPQQHQQQQQFRPQPQPLRRPHPAPPPLPRTRQDLRQLEGQLQQLVRHLEPIAEAKISVTDNTRRKAAACEHDNDIGYAWSWPGWSTLARQ
jgi:hypothetical protein